jgi:hypothetical protein
MRIAEQGFTSTHFPVSPAARARAVSYSSFKRLKPFRIETKWFALVGKGKGYSSSPGEPAAHFQQRQDALLLLFLPPKGDRRVSVGILEDIEPVTRVKNGGALWEGRVGG